MPNPPFNDLQKQGALGTMLAAALAPRFLTSAGNYLLRRPKSPLNNYFASMHRKGIEHGLAGGTKTLAPNWRRPLLSMLGPASGFADYELGLHHATQALAQGRKHLPPGTVNNFDAPAAWRQAQPQLQSMLRENLQQQGSQHSKLLANAQAAVEGQPRSRIADWLEQRFLRDSPPQAQARRTSGLAALRTGIAEAALTPHAPVRGFLSGSLAGVVESLPDSWMLGTLARGVASPVMNLKSRVIRSGARQHQDPRWWRGLMHRTGGALDYNLHELTQFGKQLASTSQQKGPLRDASQRYLADIDHHTHEPMFRDTANLIRNSARNLSAKYFPNWHRSGSQPQT